MQSRKRGAVKVERAGIAAGRCTAVDRRPIGLRCKSAAAGMDPEFGGRGFAARRRPRPKLNLDNC